MYADDLAQLEAGMALYDAFYRWCRDATDETHNWPAKPAKATARARHEERAGMSHGSSGRAARPCPTGAVAAGAAAHGVSFAEAVRVWARVAALSFGGPAGQIAVMHRILVEEKRWIGENRFLHALNYCMLLPGPEAQQLATYIGWLLHRTPRRHRRRRAVRRCRALVSIMALS